MAGCEICGKETGNPRKIVTDDCTMIVCEDCSSFGKLIEERSARKQEPLPAEKSFERKGFERKGLDSFSAGNSLAEDYGKRIQKARQKKDLTLEELGKKVFEKASHLQRIESQQIKPSDEIARKLEKVLETSLMDSNEPVLEEKFKLGFSDDSGITMLDLMKKKQEKAE